MFNPLHFISAVRKWRGSSLIRRDRRRSARHLDGMERLMGKKFLVFYDRHETTIVADLCAKYGSDKGGSGEDKPYDWVPHTYADYYARLFLLSRHHTRKVFECGLGTNDTSVPSNMGSRGQPGASLRVWRDFFPNAMVYGADIDEQILFQEERIKTFHVDQTNPASIEEMWNHVNETDFDLIVDDGLHTLEAGICFFENSISKLSPSGVYVIEDVHLRNLSKFQSFFSRTRYLVDYVVMFRENVKIGDNSLIIVRNPTA
jgi:hypothetical protein